MDKLKTRVLFISLIILTLVSVSAVAAADVNDVVSVEQDDIDLSEETITDVEDTSDDSQDSVAVADASKNTQSNSNDVLRDVGDDSHITLIFNKMSSSGPKTTTQTGQATYNGAWSNGKIFANHVGTASFDYNGRHYEFLYWEDEDGNHYLSTDRFSAPGNGSDYTLTYNAIYAISPSQVTINWEMQSPEGVVKETETKTVAEGAPITVTMEDFEAKIAPYKSFDVGSGEDIKHYEFDHWEDADGNEITESQVLAYTGIDYSVKYTAKYTVSVPTSNVTVVFIKKDENGDVISNESNVLEPGMTWTIDMATFDNQISNYKEFDLNNVHYDFTHWEDADGNEVTGPQTFKWTGENYTVTYIAKYEGIAPAHVTVIFTNMSAAGAVSNNVSNDIYQGNSWIINMTKFDNEIANYMNFTYEGKFYNFSHWIDEDGNKVTEPQTFEWADHDYTVTYTAVYDSYELSNVTLIFTNMSAEGSKVTTNESNVLGPGVSWTIYQEKFDNQIANYRNFDDENGVNYEFVQWVDEEGNPVNLPQTFEWTGENQTYTYIAQYKLTKPSNVTVVFNKMSANGPVSSNISNVIAIGDDWTILKAKFDNQIYGYTDFYYQGAHYVFNHWENETNDEVTEQTFEWTGEDYTRTMTAIYDIYPDCNITVIWDMKSSDGPVSTNDSKIVRHPRNWTVTMDTFDSQLPEKEFHYDGVYYIFSHWEDEEGNEVTEDQVLPWAEENYTVTYKAIYEEYPDIWISVVWEDILSSQGEIAKGQIKTVRYNTVWTVTMDTFDSQLPEKEFNYSGSHYIFKHWVDEDGNEVTENQVLPWQPEPYTRIYHAVYEETLILETSVSNESATDKPGKTVTVEFTVNDQNGDAVPNGTLTVTVEGTEYSANVTEGKVTFDIVLPDMPGEYLYDVTYSGTDYYYPSVGQLNLTVQKVDVIVTLPEVINYTGAVVDIVVDVVDEYGNLVNEGTVTLTIDWGTKLSDKLMATAQTLTEEVHDGKATFSGITLGEPGTYPSKAEYSGTDYYNEAENESDVVVLPLDTTTESQDVSGKAGDKKDITADIVDQNGNPVKNGTAVLKVNGKEYTAEVKDGKATFKDVELPDESTEATIEYLGNEYYNPSNTTIQITIIPEDEPIDDNETEEEPSTPTSEKTVPVMPAAGNPIALVVVALLSLVSTVSFGRKK